MHRSTLAAGLLATLTVAMLADSPAVADSKSVRDPRGDAPARFDLTTVHATNSVSDITVRAHIRDLQGHETQIFGVTLRPVSGDSYYTLATVRRKSGRTTARLDTIDSTGNFTEVPCHILASGGPRRTSSPSRSHEIASQNKDRCASTSTSVRATAPRETQRTGPSLCELPRTRQSLDEYARTVARSVWLHARCGTPKRRSEASPWDTRAAGRWSSTRAGPTPHAGARWSCTGTL